jgi:hypothetical protein
MFSLRLSESRDGPPRNKTGDNAARELNFAGALGSRGSLKERCEMEKKRAGNSIGEEKCNRNSGWHDTVVRWLRFFGNAF